MMKCRGMGRAMKPVAMKMGGGVPKGHHRMPDGSIMANSAHKKKGGANRLAQQAAIAINMKKRGKKPRNA